MQTKVSFQKELKICILILVNYMLSIITKKDRRPNITGIIKKKVSLSLILIFGIVVHRKSVLSQKN